MGKKTFIQKKLLKMSTTTLAITNGNTQQQTTTLAITNGNTQQQQIEQTPVVKKTTSRMGSLFKRGSSTGNLSTSSTNAGSSRPHSQSTSEIDETKMTESMNLKASTLNDTWETVLTLTGPDFIIGITFTDGDEQCELDVLEIAKHSAAYDAGLKQGDVIVELDGVYLDNGDDFSDKMSGLRNEAWTAGVDHFDITLKVRGGSESGRKNFNSVDKNGNVVEGKKNKSTLASLIGKKSSDASNVPTQSLPTKKKSLLSRFSRKKSTDSNSENNTNTQNMGKYQTLEEQVGTSNKKSKKDLDLFEDLNNIMIRTLKIVKKKQKN